MQRLVREFNNNTACGASQPLRGQGKARIWVAARNTGDDHRRLSPALRPFIVSGLQDVKAGFNIRLGAEKRQIVSRQQPCKVSDEALSVCVATKLSQQIVMLVGGQ